jgi:hypothetical protein
LTTPKLAMPELVVGQAGKELTHNQALAILDQLAQATVVDKDLATPPGSPVNGAMYIVAAGATGAWSGQSGNLAVWLDAVAGWTFIAPADGWSTWVTDEAARYERKAGFWVVAGSSGSVTLSPVILVSTTTRNAALTDIGCYVNFSNTAPKSYTVMQQSTVSWTADAEITVANDNTSDLTLIADTGVTLKAPSGGTLVLAPDMVVTIKRTSSNIWRVIGQTK